jgi:integrase
MGVVTSGYVQKRGRSWYAYYREDGIKRGKVIKGARNKTEAERYLKTEILGNNVAHLHRGNIRFSKYAYKWLDRKRPYLKPSVYDRYLLNLRKHIVPFFSEKKINSIYAGHIQDFVKHLSRKKSAVCKTQTSNKVLSPKTVNNNLMILSAMFSDAVDDRLIEENPVKIKKHRLDVDQKEVDYFACEDMQRFLKHVRGEYKPFFFLLWNTGLRVNEATALKWSSIDFNNNLICIEKSIYRRYGTNGVPEVIETKPKSRAGIREVPLTPQLGMVLNELKRIKSIQSIEGYIFERKIERSQNTVSRFEPYIADGIVRSVFRYTINQAGLRDTLTPHSIRHGFITIVRQHFPEWFVKRIVGHYTPDTTDLYTHINMQEYAKQLGDLLNIDLDFGNKIQTTY